MRGYRGRCASCIPLALLLPPPPFQMCLDFLFCLLTGLLTDEFPFMTAISGWAQKAEKSAVSV